MPDAAGLVLAGDQDDARAYAAIVHRLTGEKPALILSDDPKASRRIEQFRNSDQRIAVCVRMISEGVDIPRAACLAWMTSYRTPLFFAQAVGRVVRARGAARDGDGVPARGAAAAGAGRRDSRSTATTSWRRRRRPGGDRRHRRARSAAGSNRADRGGDGGAGLAGRVRPCAALRPGGDRGLAPAPELADRRRGGLSRPARAAHPRADRCAAGQPGLGAAPAGRRRPARGGRPAAGHRHGRRAGVGGLPGWRAAAGLRREVNQLVGRVAARTGAPHATVHGQLRRAVPGPASASPPVPSCWNVAGITCSGCSDAGDPGVLPPPTPGVRPHPGMRVRQSGRGSRSARRR